ncbi:MAG: YicC/YloC family endoribonuclease [Candidatus Omnitrophota bacterium]
MIKSMTGFGRGSEKTPYGTITVEAKTLNHKSLSVTCSPLNGFFLLEDKIKDIFQKKIVRGKIFVKVTRESEASQKPLYKIKVNEDVARDYIKKIRKTQKELSVGGELKIQDVIAFPGVIESNANKSAGRLWPYIKKATEKALTNLMEYRKSEGAKLAKDFNARLGRINKALKGVKKYEKQCVADYRGKLTRAMEEISEKTDFTRSRVEEEAALFAKNYDITEEITRLENHIAACRKTLKATKADVGKKLDFIAQEMHREANTIGSKSADYRISKAVIEIKSEIEKIREQVKNVE